MAIQSWLQQVYQASYEMKKIYNSFHEIQLLRHHEETKFEKFVLV